MQPDTECRLEGIFARHGVDLSRTTLCGWVADVAAALAPIGEQLRREVTAATNCRQTTRRRRCWTSVAASKTGSGRISIRSARKSSSTRRRPNERDGPDAFLARFRGYLQADAYTGYDGLYASGRIVEVGCFAHARRRFVDALTTDPQAATVVAVLQQLYQVERAGVDLDPEARRALRQAQSVPLLARLETIRRALAQTVLPKSPLGDALRYLANQWTALQRIVEDGRLAIDDNRAENQLRVIAVGRKNWLFAGSFEGARRAALLYSLVQSCRLIGVRPFDYLKDVLLRVATRPHRRLAELTPKFSFCSDSSSRFLSVSSCCRRRCSSLHRWLSFRIASASAWPALAGA